jgi:hypothetical protein
MAGAKDGGDKISGFLVRTVMGQKAKAGEVGQNLMELDR